jgi:hypothetical protein
MDYILNWVLGIAEAISLSHGEIFSAIASLTDREPVGWREGFRREGHYVRQRAELVASV